jgi:hypothetical protein
MTLKTNKTKYNPNEFKKPKKPQTNKYDPLRKNKKAYLNLKEYL